MSLGPDDQTRRFVGPNLGLNCVVFCIISDPINWVRGQLAVVTNASYIEFDSFPPCEWATDTEQSAEKSSCPRSSIKYPF